MSDADALDQPASAPDARESPKISRYDRRRLEVFDAAIAEFARKGFDATTIDDLVRATGLQRGGLYHYIGSKGDLLIEVHERFISPLLERAAEIEARNITAREAIREIGRALMEVLDQYRDQAIVFINEWRSIRDKPEWNAVRKSRTEFESTIERVVIRGIEEGDFQTEDPTLSTLAFLGMFNYSVQWFREAGRRSSVEVADHFCDIFLDGLADSADP